MSLHAISIHSPRKLYVKVAIVMLAFALLVPMVPGMTAIAAAKSLDTIRVALFIQTRDQAPSVTLTIGSDATIGVRQSQGVSHWLDVEPGADVRFTLDQYRVVLAETGDLSNARTIATQVNGVMNARERAFVIGTGMAGSAAYRVVAVGYSELSEAQAALDRLASNRNVGSLLNNPQLQGPYRLTAGSFAWLEEAEAVKDQYVQQGIDAAVVYHEDEQGKLAYAVWVGAEISTDRLAALQSRAEQAVPGFALREAKRDEPYLYERQDYTDGNPISHYYINANGQKVWYSSAQPGIKVYERYGRTYRGSMEITQYNGKLALINELPFEQYLYAVVSNEMGGGFPTEALKAQAVAARTYALQQGMKYGIAHISDTTFDQAYFGYGTESQVVIRAVDATASEVVVSKSNKSLITPFYSSNAGGHTSETDEVWGTAVSYLHSVPSPDDIAAKGRYHWYRIITPNGLIGYIREDLVQPTGIKTETGLQELVVSQDQVNIRPGPDTSGAPVGQASRGDKLIAFEYVTESNPYSWITPLWDAETLRQRINQYVREPINGELRSLKVTNRGQSGRVMEVVANGNQKLLVSYPDAYRTVFNGLRSTRFDIEQSNDLTILGAEGASRNLANGGKSVHVLSARHRNAQPLQSDYMFVMNSKQDIRLGTQSAQFRFIGYGYGHGLGMSQYGAMALAELGYDYKEILQYYYKDVEVIKG